MCQILSLNRSNEKKNKHKEDGRILSQVSHYNFVYLKPNLMLRKHINFEWNWPAPPSHNSHIQTGWHEQLMALLLSTAWNSFHKLEPQRVIEALFTIIHIIVMHTGIDAFFPPLFLHSNFIFATSSSLTNQLDRIRVFSLLKRSYVNRFPFV